uniref:MAM domain-containing protein n=1 Tax=Fundulus heteroclitus TaxID=8078 RepID=A0A3Q2PL13_FUNHE
HPCIDDPMVMYTHQFGPRSGGLTVLVADRLISPVWERGGALGDLWVKAEVEIVSDSVFQILIMAAIRDFDYGGIAVDSIVLSPECRLSSGMFVFNPLTGKDFNNPKEKSLLCDSFNFEWDFSYAEGSSGWTDTSVGSTNCAIDELIFDFSLTGSLEHIGELSVRVIDSLLGPRPKLWEFSGKTGAQEEEEAWKHAEILIGVRKHRFQLAFEARAVKVQPYAWIKVRNVHFTSFSWPTGLSCNFEEGLCGWYQDNSDDFDWSVVTGMDHTVGIGETVQNNHFLKVLFILFYSFFFNHNNGTFVSVFKPFLREPWAKSDCMINTTERKHGTPLKTPVVLQQLSIEAVRSGFDGQVAIDDVTFLDGPCALPRKCSFEGQKCGYSSYGAVRWLHRSGRTTTANGPKTDHTLGTELGYYMMVNADADILPAGQTTVLASPVRPGTSKLECVSFWYHMQGNNPGYLTVYMKPEKGERVPIFSESLNQGDDWRHGQGNVSSGLVDWQLEFEVVGSGSRGSHVAVDDISVSAHPCEDQASKCSLENGMCNWSNIQNNERDKLDWELTSPEAERHYPVPPEDHTLGTEKGHFLFFPSSNRTPANENAWLLSSHLPPTQATCLRFWAYKLHSSDCQLKIWILSGGLIYEQLTVNELGEPWRHFELNITSREEYQIVFEGIKGTSGFLALDDIEYTVGFDCATRVTEPTSKKPDNAGGIAASVIVVLLLIGTLVALLVFYLRTTPEAQAPPTTAGFSNEGYVSDTRVR